MGLSQVDLSSDILYEESNDKKGNRLYFEKDKSKDVDVDTSQLDELELDSETLEKSTKDLHLYKNNIASYPFIKSNYKKNNIYCFDDDNPGVTTPSGKVTTTKLEVVDIEII